MQQLIENFISLLISSIHNLVQEQLSKNTVDSCALIYGGKILYTHIFLAFKCIVRYCQSILSTQICHSAKIYFCHLQFKSSLSLVKKLSTRLSAVSKVLVNINIYFAALQHWTWALARDHHLTSQWIADGCFLSRFRAWTRVLKINLTWKG